MANPFTMKSWSPLLVAGGAVASFLDLLMRRGTPTVSAGTSHRASAHR
jgi:hypothetical protein